MKPTKASPHEIADWSYRFFEKQFFIEAIIFIISGKLPN